MFVEIKPIGFESSKRIGKVILQNRSLKIELPNEEIMITLTSKDRNDYFYTDYIENSVNIFKIVCHVIKANGNDKDVVGTFFLKEKKDYIILKEYIEQLKLDQKDTIKNKEDHPNKVIRNHNGMGWLSRGRNRL